MRISPIKITIVLVNLSFVILLSACSKEEAMSRQYEKQIEYKQIGECEVGGKLSIVNYTGFNLMSFLTGFMNLFNPEKFSYCIPALDKEKVKALNKEEKQALDTAFFNALQNKNHLEKITKNGEVKYLSITLRQLQELVRKGSELAYLDLHLVDYYDNHKSFNFTENSPYYLRLKELANNGDADALCLYSRRIPTPFPSLEHLKEPPSKHSVYEIYQAQKKGQTLNLNTEEFNAIVKERHLNGPENKWSRGSLKAAKMGSSECMSMYGGSLLSGSEMLGIQKNQKQGLKYLIEAAKKGSARAAHVLSLKYYLGKQLPYNLGKYACWAEVYNHTYPKPHLEEDYESMIWSLNSVEKDLNYTKYSAKSFCQNIIEE